MLSFKEILILIFVLFGCLVITFSHTNQSINQPSDIKDIEEENIKATDSDKSRDKISGLFREIDDSKISQTQSRQAEPPSQLSADVNLSIEEITPISKVAETGNITNSEITYSLEDILAEVENLASELKLEFANIQAQKESCSSCGQTENLSPSICATILTAAGGVGCSCAPPCCIPGEGCPCAHPCCCVCCQLCCL
jgi:vacuolar-type H+-ATPase subunit I/STV1